MVYADCPKGDLCNGLAGCRFLIGLQKLNSFSVMQRSNEKSSNGQTTSQQNRAAHETSLQVFNFDSSVQIRTVLIENEPWFVAADLCSVLAHTNASVAMSMLDDDECKKVDPKKFLESHSNMPVWIVNESGLYTLIVRSTKPNAKKFRKWVTSEVLPSIRKTGSYSTPQSKLPISFTPTKCIVTTCVDENGREKQVAMLYDNADCWYGYRCYDGNQAGRHMSSFETVALYDKTVVKYKTTEHTIVDGKYTEGFSLQAKKREPERPDDPITECKAAFENLQNAQKRVKTAAKNVYENINA